MTKLSSIFKSVGLAAVLSTSCISFSATLDVEAVSRIGHLPFRGGHAALQYDGRTISGVVFSHGCRYDVYGLRNVSVYSQPFQPGLTFVKLSAVTASTCLPQGPERFYADLQVRDDGRISIAHLYYRVGRTNHPLATCGRFASVTTPGASCE